MKCEKLFDKIDELYNQYLDVLEDVCNIESPTSYKEGIDATGRYFARMAEERGWKVEVYKQEIAGDVVCITMNPEAEGVPFTLSGHIDTVQPLGLFGTPAVKRDDENMYGPGVIDCKGGVVAGFLAMDALEQVGFGKRPIQLLLQTDEETSSVTSGKSTIDYICKKAEGSVAFLNLEGHIDDSAVLTRKGILRFYFTVHGKAAHSSICYEGSNAILEAAHKIIRLEEMKNADGLTCNCGVISGGTVPNSVAASCNFYADIRFSSEDEMNTAKEKVKEIAETSYIGGCTCDVEEFSYRPAMEYAERNYELLEKMNEIYAENGLPVLRARSALGGSDAAYITKCGIPCVDSIGTEGGRYHSVDEYISMISLANSAKRIASVVYCI